MITRVLIAVLGALLITGTMLLGMSEFTAVFRQRSGEKLYLVTDIIRMDRSGRPDRPRAAQLPPERAAPELDRNGPQISVRGLSDLDGEFAIERAPALPELDDDDRSEER
jgi:hypothetical protein